MSKHIQRILILGGPGSGKSTLARAVANRLGLPCVHLDQIYWLPGWVEQTEGQIQAATRQAADADCWVIEGNYSDSWEHRAERANLIVSLDMPRGLRMWRIFKRTLRHYGQSRPDMTPGCPERMSWEFLRFAWGYDAEGRKKMTALLDRWQERRQVLCLGSRAEVRKFLDGI